MAAIHISQNFAPFYGPNYQRHLLVAIAVCTRLLAQKNGCPVPNCQRRLTDNIRNSANHLQVFLVGGQNRGTVNCMSTVIIIVRKLHGKCREFCVYKLIPSHLRKPKTRNMSPKFTQLATDGLELTHNSPDLTSKCGGFVIHASNWQWNRGKVLKIITAVRRAGEGSSNCWHCISAQLFSTLESAWQHHKQSYPLR